MISHTESVSWVSEAISSRSARWCLSGASSSLSSVRRWCVRELFLRRSISLNSLRCSLNLFPSGGRLARSTFTRTVGFSFGFFEFFILPLCFFSAIGDRDSPESQLPKELIDPADQKEN